MKYLTSAALAVAGILAVTTNASAAVVCNGEGDCWRTKEKYGTTGRSGVSTSTVTIGNGLTPTKISIDGATTMAAVIGARAFGLASSK